MRHHRTAIASLSGAIALSALGVGVGVSGVGAGAATAYGPSTKRPSPAATSLGQPARAQRARAATLHAATTTVGAKTETILVNGQDVPLYYYRLDRTKKSLVTGALAQFWPALVVLSPSATATGARGTLTVVKDADGQHVAYNGHFLYTFIEDTPGHVTGQGVQNFFVATPALKKATGHASSTKVPPDRSGGRYGY
jgi:predicted lipoprotein with Yx(FWY)xxD motif